MKKLIKNIVGIFSKVIVCAIFGWPFFWMISTSLQTIDEVNTVVPTFIPAVPQFKNYAEAWNSGPYGMGLYMKNSLTVIVIVILLQAVIMVPAAYAFAKYNFRFKGLLFGMILIALMMPTQITFLPIYLMMSDWKLIPTLLPQILPFATNAFAIFLLRQNFMQIPNELIEAARIDNANELNIITRIMLPMSKPAITTVVLFSFVNHWNEYFWPLVMTNSDSVRTLPIGIAQLKELEGLGNSNIMMAGNAILVVPILILYLFGSKQLIKSFAYTGIK